MNMFAMFLIWNNKGRNEAEHQPHQVCLAMTHTTTSSNIYAQKLPYRNNSHFRHIDQKMNLLLLPDELLLNIGEQITSESDLNNFHQVNRRLYHMFHEYLYIYDAKYHDGLALFSAIRHGNVNVVRKSVMAGTSLDPRPWPFTWVETCLSGHSPIKKYIRGYCPWRISDPLTQAVRWNQPEVTKTLLEFRAYQNWPGSLHELIYEAVKTPSALKELLEHGVDPNRTHRCMYKYCDQTALLVAARHGYLEAAKVLLEYGADIEKTRDDEPARIRPLHWAARAGHPGVVKLLLDAGAEINPPMTLFRDIPILQAAKHGAFDVVDLLIDRDADFNFVGPENRTVLFYVARRGSTKLMEKLLRHGARPNTACLFEVLFTRERDDHYERAKLLLEYGLDPNIPYPALKGPKFLFPWLFRPLWLGTSVVKLLLEHGLDPNLTSPGSIPPLVTVASGKYGYRVVRLMLEHGADPNVGNPEGGTPLLIAAANEHLELVEMLLHYGADPNIAVRGQSLLGWAIKRGRDDIAQLLKSK